MIEFVSDVKIADIIVANICKETKMTRLAASLNKSIVTTDYLTSLYKTKQRPDLNDFIWKPRVETNNNKRKHILFENPQLLTEQIEDDDDDFCLAMVIDPRLYVIEFLSFVELTSGINLKNMFATLTLKIKNYGDGSTFLFLAFYS